MRTVDLVPVQHSVKIGDICGHKEPNCTVDTLFMDAGQIVGFYLAQVPPQIANLANIANHELNSERVPKSEMRRSSGMMDSSKEVLQFSTIIGSVPPKANMRRNYPTISSVHRVKTAETFIKAMLLLAELSEELIREIAPNVFERQVKIIAENTPEKFRFSRMFTSSISNFNISAPYHRDTGNLEGCVNVIIAKKRAATGGHTTVPDYDLTVNSCDNSMLVYPAWRNVHAVTPIVPVLPGGYRNSLVFYPLKAFKKYLALPST
jgi:hypothetical protein